MECHRCVLATKSDGEWNSQRIDYLRTWLRKARNATSTHMICRFRKKTLSPTCVKAGCVQVDCDYTYLSDIVQQSFSNGRRYTPIENPILWELDTGIGNCFASSRKMVGLVGIIEINEDCDFCDQSQYAADSVHYDRQEARTARIDDPPMVLV